MPIRPEPQGVRLGDPVFEALPGARADFGRLGGTVYQVEMPANWNHRLVTSVDAKLANTSSATTTAITTATSDMTTAAGGFALVPSYMRSTATHGTYTVDTTDNVAQATYP